MHYDTRITISLVLKCVLSIEVMSVVTEGAVFDEGKQGCFSKVLKKLHKLLNIGWITYATVY